MYKFKGSNPSQLTCRRWILDPNGCDDYRCPYLHSVTSKLSPPCAYACWAYNNGGCDKSQDECMYTHLRLDIPTNISTMYPHLGSQDLSIARAAADAGFDCSEWPKLRQLLIAVRSAASCTQRYNGKRPHQPYRTKAPSSLYPDKWRPDTIRPRLGVAEAYRQADRIPSVPSFSKSAEEILRDLGDNGHNKGSQLILRPQYENQPTMKAGDKRNATEANALEVRPVKRIKAEFLSQATGADAYKQSGAVTDLTQDDEHAATSIHQNAQPAQGMRYNLRSNAMNHRNRGRNRATRRRPVPKNIVRNDTNSIINRCADKLRSALHGIETDRESLRQRWEIDEDLKFQTVTDHLADLNDCFIEAEAALQAAVAVIDTKLLARDGY